MPQDLRSNREWIEDDDRQPTLQESFHDATTRQVIQPRESSEMLALRLWLTCQTNGDSGKALVQ